VKSSRSVTLPLACALAACGGSGSPGATDAPRSPLDSPAPADGAHDAPSAPADGSAGPHHHAHWVLGYYVGYQINDYPIADIDWSALTDIAFSPMIVHADLSLDTTFDDTNGTGPADAMALAQAAHAHGVNALLMLGGANAGVNIATATQDANRPAFVTALLATMDQLGFDGIDLDWEDSVDLDHLVALAQDLRAARPAIELTYPGFPINPNIDTVDARYATLAASLDQFNLQTYYPDTAETGQGWDSWFVSPLSGSTGSTPVAIDDSLARYGSAGVPAAKLGMGTAFYAICYTGGITAPRQPTTAANTIEGGDNNDPLSAFYASGGLYEMSSDAITVDAVAHEPYLDLAVPVTDAHCGATPTQYVSYEDEPSLAAKGAFAHAHGYGGIIVWTLAEGYLPVGAAGGRSRTALFDALGSAFLP
jgi:chitinase